MDALVQGPQYLALDFIAKHTDASTEPHCAFARATTCSASGGNRIGIWKNWTDPTVACVRSGRCANWLYVRGMLSMISPGHARLAWHEAGMRANTSTAYTTRPPRACTVPHQTAAQNAFVVSPLDTVMESVVYVYLRVAACYYTRIATEAGFWDFCCRCCCCHHRHRRLDHLIISF